MFKNIKSKISSKMDRIKKGNQPNSPTPQEHNTNQNEAASDVAHKPLCNIDSDKPKVMFDLDEKLDDEKPSHELQDNIAAQDKENSMPPVPSIIITPPSPVSELNVEQCDKDNTLNRTQVSCPEFDGEWQRGNLQDVEMSCLKTPEPIGARIIESCPPTIQTKAEISANVTENETNIDDLCNCSSTPKKSAKISLPNDNSEESSMITEPPSPISKEITDEGEAPTPKRKIVSSRKSETDKDAESMDDSDDSPPSNISVITPTCHAQRAVPHKDTPHPKVFDMGRTEPRSDDSMSSCERSFSASPVPPGVSHHYNDFYNPAPDSSWTDMGMRAAAGGFSGPGGPPEEFVYPSIYVSGAGLISVLLRNDMSVEMTVDRTLRVVSHQHVMAVAVDSRGTAATLHHPAAKLMQAQHVTDIATDTFRARMGAGEAIVFSNGVHNFRLEDSDLQPCSPLKFSDISRDQSVNLLFSSEGYGESLVSSCMQVAAQAEYSNLPKGGVIVRINGVKVTQTGSGDVSVATGAKFIRLSPHHGTARLANRFVDIEIEKDWTVKLTKGAHSFCASRRAATVCNGKMEAGFDENNCLKVASLVPRHPLLPADAPPPPVNPSMNGGHHMNGPLHGPMNGPMHGHLGGPGRRPPMRKPARFMPPPGPPGRRRPPPPDSHHFGPLPPPAFARHHHGGPPPPHHGPYHGPPPRHMY